jgi:hypothetical protein
MTLDQLTKRRDKFEAFLTERGAQILQPTNEWEVLRFKTSHGTSIFYRNARDQVTPTGQAMGAWRAFEDNLPWRGAPATKRWLTGKEKTLPIVNALMKRDGTNCFYCSQKMPEDDRSIEHLVPVAHGGPNHLSNLVLAHRKCNTKAGHLSAMDKIRLRESRGAQ